MDRTALQVRLLGAIALVAGVLIGAAPAARAASTPAGPAITVSGSHLLRNGIPWIPRGVQIVGLVAPKDSLYGKYVEANAHFGSSELQEAIADHADTIRFQVSQYGLDSQDPLYSRAYVRDVYNAVELARSLGLAVIVSLQAQSPAGNGTNCPLPNVGAQDAWNELAPMFGGDAGVMFELYNEPSLGANLPDWQLWAYGGPVAQSDGNVCQEVGMQTLINDIRANGAGNVIIVPGLGGESTFYGSPPLTDPTSPSLPQLAYGIHYPSLAKGSSVWDRNFGNLSASAPVIVTEWYANSVNGCVAGEPAKAAWLLTYLASKGIGTVGYAFDVPGTIVADWSYNPTSYANFACGTGSGGPGQLLLGEYAGLAQAADGPTQVDPAWMLTYGAAKRLIARAPVVAHRFFDTPRTFVTGASQSSLAQLGLPAATPATMFEDETALARAVNRHTLWSGTGAVVYDDEDWKLTPKNQQLHPAHYYQLAAQVAHRHGLLLIATPGTDLVTSIAPKTHANQTFAKFLRLGIAGAAARYADVYAVQAQSAETNATKYRAFVAASAAQARQTHIGVSILSGVSTSPVHAKVGSGVLLRAVVAAQEQVSGYWLSVPRRGQTCPACTGPYSADATAFLRGLGAEGG